MASIQTNLLALTGQQRLTATNKALNSAIERLSSGERINSAADDAAGQGIANRMEANLRANDQVSQGINDGISLVQTAESGLDGINDILQRSRELAIQAASDTLSEEDRAVVNAEYMELREEIDHIANGTEIFGKHPLKGAGNAQSLEDKFVTNGNTLYGQTSGLEFISFIPEGATDIEISLDAIGIDDDIQLFSKDGTHLVGTPVEGASADITWSGNGVTSGNDVEDKLFKANSLPDADYDDSSLLHHEPTAGESYNQTPTFTGSYNGMTFTYTGDGDRFDSDTQATNGQTDSAHAKEKLKIDAITETLFLAASGSGSYNVTAKWGTMPDNASATPGTDIAMSADYGQKMDKVTINPLPADHVSLGLKDVALDPAEKAREAMEKLQQAMNKVDGYRGRYGALTNRFEGAIDNLSQQSLNTSAARSRIMDADYAEEVSRMTKAQILQHAGTSMLAQANQTPQNALSLLEG